MPVQTTYLDNMPVAQVGQVADSRLTDIISRLCEDATLDFGVAVIQGTADEEVKVGAAGVYVGVTVRDPSIEPSAANQDKYLAGDSVGVMTRGAVWVTAPATVAAGDPVYRTAAGVITPTDTSNTLIANAVFETSGSTNDLVRVGLR